MLENQVFRQAVGGRGKYSNLKALEGSTVAFASKVLPYAKSKLDTMKPGLLFIL